MNRSGWLKALFHLPFGFPVVDARVALGESLQGYWARTAPHKGSHWLVAFAEVPQHSSPLAPGGADHQNGPIPQCSHAHLPRERPKVPLQLNTIRRPSPLRTLTPIWYYIRNWPTS
jgi:hypothetical protein